MRQIAAELDWNDDGFTVVRLTDENGNDLTWMVDTGDRFAALDQLAAALAEELGDGVAIDEA